ncbi:MAG: hypothetical protein WCH43_11760 [Verrucomicrobiota bacterium]
MNTELQSITKRFICLIIGITLTNCAFSQVYHANATPKQKPEIPEGPLLNSAPNFSKWIITYAYPEDQIKTSDTGNPPQRLLPYQSKRPRTRITTKTGEIFHEETIDISGGKYEKWQFGSEMYVKTPGLSYWGVLDSRSHNEKVTAVEEDSLPIPASGFRGLDLVNKQNYAGLIKTSHGENFVFIIGGSNELDLSNSKTANAKLETLANVIFIDASTRLPVIVNTPEVKQTIVFAPPPTATLVMPSDLSAQINNAKALRAKLIRPGPLP